MTLKICEVVSILLSALVVGAFWGIWLALSRSATTFTAEVFLEVAHRMIRNVEPVMTVLMPAALLAIVSVVYVSYYDRPKTAYVTLIGFGWFMVSALITLRQLPLMGQIKIWTGANLPENWEEIRDRWKKFNSIRVATSIVALALLVVGAVI